MCRELRRDFSRRQILQADIHVTKTYCSLKLLPSITKLSESLHQYFCELILHWKSALAHGGALHSRQRDVDSKSLAAYSP